MTGVPKLEQQNIMVNYREKASLKSSHKSMHHQQYKHFGKPAIGYRFYGLSIANETDLALY
jgi:hypothetical protein